MCNGENMIKVIIKKIKESGELATDANIVRVLRHLAPKDIAEIMQKSRRVQNG